VQSKFSSNSRSSSAHNFEEIERRFEYFVLEFICNLVFTIELTLRLIAAPNRFKFLRGFANIVDIIAIVPFWTAIAINNLNIFNNFKFFNYATYKTSAMTTPSAAFSDSSKPTTTMTMTTATSIAETLTTTATTVSTIIATTAAAIYTATTKRPSNQYGLSVLRILRLTRVLRVLKLSRHIRALYIMGKILYECMYEIILLLTFLAMNIVIFSSFMYYIELQALGDASPFLSIPHSFWWAVISFTTIGYGDLIPHSNAGKFFGSFFIVCGILIALLPVPILSCKFEKIYKEFSQENLKKDRQRRERERLASERQIAKLQEQEEQRKQQVEEHQQQHKSEQEEYLSS
jgi:hypothetical protein